MLQYFEKVSLLLKEVETKEKKNIKLAIDALYEANVNKNSIYIFGASHAGILAEEMYYRAGGMMNINAIFGQEVMLDRSPITFTSKMERLEGYGTNLASTVDFQANDILILHSVSGRNPVTLELAIEARKRGVKVISITNLEYSKTVTSRHSSRKRLFELSDIVIDNHGDVGDGSCEVPGMKQKVGPTSTVVGASILNSIIVEVSKLLVENGSKAPVFYSANIDGGDELNNELFNEFKQTIHYKY